jgi:hypothetical protein
MPIELRPGTDNVIAFPVEMPAKPSMLLLRQLRPDIGIPFVQARGFGFELPDPGLRDRTDEATAEHIAGHLGAGGRAPARFLDELLEPLLSRAVDAAQKAAIAAVSAEAARRVAEGSHAPDFLKEHALTMSKEAVRLALEAHALCEKTLGVERAVRYAREGKPWVPRDHIADMESKIAAEIARLCRLVDPAAARDLAAWQKTTGQKVPARNWRRLHRAPRNSAEQRRQRDADYGSHRDHGSRRDDARVVRPVE